MFIIATRRSGSDKIVPDGSYGVILDDDSPESIATALRTVAADPEYRRSAAEKCFCLLNERFTWEGTAKKTEAIAEKGE